MKVEELEATDEVLEPRVERSELRRGPVVVSSEPTNNSLLLVQLVQFIF